MPGLCPACGRPECAHTAFDRGQSLKEFHEDRIRRLTRKEEEALHNDDRIAMIEAAQEVKRLRRAGRFRPCFPEPKVS